MKLIIIEDEKLAAEKMQRMLHQADPSIEIVGSFESIEESRDWLNSNPMPDLIVSDIHLTDGLCFDLFAKMETQCPVIFTTAYEKYALQAFEVNSVDYLLKPIQKEKLNQSLEKFKQMRNNFIYNSNAFAEIKQMLTQTSQEYKSRFLTKVGQKIKSISIEKIAYFFSEDKMTFIVDKENRRLPLNNTLEEIDQMVDPKNFFRVNRKFIVHIDNIQEIQPYFKGRLVIQLDPKVEEQIVISTDRTPLFKAWLDR